MDEMFEAFGVRAEPEVAKTNPVRSMSRSVEPVPPELHALTEFLLVSPILPFNCSAVSGL